MIAACEQCGRNRVPAVAPVQKLFAYLADADRGKRRADAVAGCGHAAEAGGAGGRRDSLVGAEGGFAPAEYQAAQASGFEPVRLGPRILRTETAPVAALAVLQALWGDL